MIPDPILAYIQTGLLVLEIKRAPTGRWLTAVVENKTQVHAFGTGATLAEALDQLKADIQRFTRA